MVLKVASTKRLSSQGTSLWPSGCDSALPVQGLRVDPGCGTKIAHVKWGDKQIKQIKHFVQQAVGMSPLTSLSFKHGDGCTLVSRIVRSYSRDPQR